MSRGTLFLVVGPSGAGKDTLLDAARLQLTDNPAYSFPRRIITRPIDAGGENHIAASEEEFARLTAADALMMEWRAHGYRYGISADAARSLDAGTHVVANVSRSVLDEARRMYAPVRVLNVVVPVDILRDRLQARGRETEAAIEKRLQRASAYSVAGDDVITINNDGPVEAAAAALLCALRS
jgi:ribose 1,5-bisphosphokinase